MKTNKLIDFLPTQIIPQSLRACLHNLELCFHYLTVKRQNNQIFGQLKEINNRQ